MKLAVNYLIEQDIEKSRSRNNTLIKDTSENQTNKNNISGLQILNPQMMRNFDINTKDEILKHFLSSSKKILDNIKQNKANNNYQDLVFNIHNLKGISGNIGAEILFNYIGQIEFDLKHSEQHNKLSGDEDWLSKLISIYEKLVEEIKK